MCPAPRPGTTSTCNKPRPGFRYPTKKDAEKKVDLTVTNKLPVLKF